MNENEKRELTSTEARGYPAVTELKNRIKSLETLIAGYTSRSQQMPPFLMAKLTEWRNLKSSLARIENRILDNERQRTFITPVRTESGKRTLLG